MGLGSTFWAALGDGCRWLHSLTYGTSGSTVAAFPFIPTTFPNMIFGVVGAKMFQKPYVVGGTGGQQNVNSGYDSGFFVLCNSDTVFGGTKSFKSMMFTGVGVGNSTNPRPQWKQLGGPSSTGYVAQGEFQPAVNATNVWRGIYQTGFISDVGATRYVYATTDVDGFTWIQWPIGSATVRYWLWHYQPWAWFGAVPQVIADIAMKCGVPAAYIDQTAFDNAYDAYTLATGDAPWSTAAGKLDTKWEIGCSRKVGETCISLIMECARHSRDMYFVNEAGKLSVSSFTRPVTLTSLTLDDGIIDSVDWSETLEYLYNSAYVSWGSGVRVSGNATVNPDGSDFSASDEPRIESYAWSKLLGSKESATSIAKYGRVYLKGAPWTVIVGGQPADVTLAHYPLLMKPNTSTAVELQHVHYWLNSDSKPRRLIGVKQDLRGLNYGIGSLIQNVAVTDDARVVTSAFCIERTYNFDTMTVESVLMEVPENT